MKRVKVHPPCQNPLFVSWLEEWKEDAKTRGSDMQYCFSKALNSLRRCPIALSSGKQCRIVENFGPKLCAMLDKKLEEYKAKNMSQGFPKRDINQPSEDMAQQFLANGRGNDTAAPKRAKKSAAEKQRAKKKKIPNPQDNEIGGGPEVIGGYIPAWRSGGWAILLTLYNNLHNPDSPESMSKADLQAEAQRHCDYSLRKPEPGNRYSAWSSMSTLIQKGLVIKKSSPAKYSLTDAGSKVAKKLAEAEEKSSVPGSSSQSSETCSSVREKRLSQQFDDDVMLDSSGASSQDEGLESHLNFLEKRGNLDYFENIETERRSPPENRRNEERSPLKEKMINNHLEIFDTNGRTHSQNTIGSLSEPEIIFAPKTFDVILLIDDRETMGTKARPKDDPTLAELNEARVKFEVRNLKIGDFAWIAKCRNTSQELILPHIVERKRMDDLGASIKDGRYYEQKFRLKKSGIQNPIYLIEHHGNNQFVGLPINTLLQAAIKTLVQDGFAVKYTKNHRESMCYLTTITRMLTNIYSKKTLVSCKKEDLKPFQIEDDVMQVMVFKDFNKTASKVKNFRTKEMFIRHLLQLRGLSVDKALAIVDFYPTVKLLRNAFVEAGSSGENLLSEIKFGVMKHRLGFSISKTLHQFYTRKDF